MRTLIVVLLIVATAVKAHGSGELHTWLVVVGPLLGASVGLVVIVAVYDRASFFWRVIGQTLKPTKPQRRHR